MTRSLKILFIISLLICSVISAQNPNDALRLSEPDIISDAKNLGMGNMDYRLIEI